MKKGLLLKTMLLLCALVLGNSVYGQVTISTLTFTAKCNGSGTADNGVSWTVTSDGTESNYENARGIHYGTSSAAVSYLKLTTSGIAGTITKIVVNASGASNTSAKLNVKVNNTAFGSQESLTSSATDYTFEGSASGDIEVKLSQSSANKALYVKSITVTYIIPKAITSIALNKNTTTIKVGVTETLTATIDPSDATEAVEWSSSDEGVATVVDGVVTAVAEGSATITAASPSDNTIKDECVVTVEAPIAVTGVTLNKTATTLLVGGTETLTATVAPNDATNKNMTWESDDESVATIDNNGVVTAVAVGTATITVTTEDGRKTATCTVKVNPASVDPVGHDISDTYQLVTDASTLKAGDKLLIVNENYGKVMGADKGNNRNALNVTIDTDNHVITTLPETTQIITLEGSTDKWYFNVGDENNLYLYAASSTENYLKTASKSTAGNNGKAKITITSGNASIVFQGDNSRKTIQYNSSSTLFSCYSSGQAAVQLYRYTAETEFVITMGAAGYRTLVSARNVSLPEGLEAYIVTANSNDNVTMNKVNNVKANEPYILKGDAGNYTLTIIEEADEPTGNLLEISDNNTSNGVFVLAKKGKGVGFYRWNGGLMGAGRVYLPATNISNSIEFLGFDEEGTTSISNVNVNHNDNQWYDLSGRRVENPTKGVYIMNGKKVVIK